MLLSIKEAIIQIIKGKKNLKNSKNSKNWMKITLNLNYKINPLINYLKINPGTYFNFGKALAPKMTLTALEFFYF